MGVGHRPGAHTAGTYAPRGFPPHTHTTGGTGADRATWCGEILPSFGGVRLAFGVIGQERALMLTPCYAGSSTKTAQLR